MFRFLNYYNYIEYVFTKILTNHYKKVLFKVVWARDLANLLMKFALSIHSCIKIEVKNVRMKIFD